MRHAKKTLKLGRTAAHRRAMLANMATSLLRSHAVITTTPKARVVRSVTERLITLGKRGDLHARRLAARQVRDRDVLKKLFDEIAPQFASRQGGYTRIVKVGQRRGDGAALAKLELLIPKAAPKSTEAKAKRSKGRFSRFRRKAAGSKAEAASKSEAKA